MQKKEEENSHLKLVILYTLRSHLCEVPADSRLKES
jgi:hypothetical protein